MKNSELGVVFDMDGVLVNTEHAMKSASIESLRRFGIEPKFEDFLEFTGMGEDMFVGGVARKYGLTYETEMKDYAYEIYRKTAKDMIFVFPGVKNLLCKLKEDGYKIAVASAADFIKVETNLNCIGINVDFFDAVVTGSEVINKKPDPEIFIKAMQKINIKPEFCIIAEDALSGIKAAKAAGAYSIGVTTSFDEQTLSTVQPDYIIEKIADAQSVITEWSRKI